LAHEPLVLAEDVRAGYGQGLVLQGLTLSVEREEIVGLVGANGAGKTTFLRTMIGSLKIGSGKLLFDGAPIRPSPEAMVRAGIGLVPEGRRVFASLTVRENLISGAYTRNSREAKHDLRRMLELFPILEERRDQLAGSLSGGEQQMLAIARALISRPKLLLMDEPSLGLAPIIIQQIAEYIESIRTEMGMAVLLVEQNALFATSVSQRLYVLSGGEVVASGPASQFEDEETLVAAYWGERERKPATSEQEAAVE
jgi:branched-chain amino acid transport system ATP-binding protein